MSAIDAAVSSLEHVAAPVISAPELNLPPLDASAKLAGVIEPNLSGKPDIDALQSGITVVANFPVEANADYLMPQKPNVAGSGAAVAEKIPPDELAKGAQRAENQGIGKVIPPTEVNAVIGTHTPGAAVTENANFSAQGAAQAESNASPAESQKLSPEEEAERAQLREAASRNELKPDQMARLNELNQQEANGIPPDRYELLNKKLAAGETLSAEEESEWIGLHDRHENQKVIEALADINTPLSETVIAQLNERMSVSSKLLVEQITAQGMDIALRIMNRFEPFMFDENRMSAQTKETYRMLAELRLVLLEQEQIRQMLKQVVKQYDQYPPLIERAETELKSALDDKSDKGETRRTAATLEFNRLHGGLAALRETVAGLARQYDQGSSTARVENIMNRVKHNQGLSSFADYFWTNLRTGIRMDLENLGNNIDISFRGMDSRVQRGKDIAASA